ncbi:hypothetical protein TELCIR_17246 [Teladorsagia circumcincta]|uniref:Elapor1/2 mannose 6-phosphate receptor homology domain-containing protein n=1 Tax=Teladorsagia circumcincta TaxID=45464 RepID=A0A2G9TVG8_TELCI|nr:hypothetical protein TELCIR_17246 [Teladorsagia circumcincta]
MLLLLQQDALQAKKNPRFALFLERADVEPMLGMFQMRLPHTCPDGTCDGCLFHAIVESVQACPICGPGDYEMIRGECTDGQQTIHHIPDK